MNPGAVLRGAPASAARRVPSTPAPDPGEEGHSPLAVVPIRGRVLAAAVAAAVAALVVTALVGAAGRGGPSVPAGSPTPLEAPGLAPAPPPVIAPANGQR